MKERPKEEKERKEKMMTLTRQMALLDRHQAPLGGLLRCDLLFIIVVSVYFDGMACHSGWDFRLSLDLSHMIPGLSRVLKGD